jgi:hypothetical protein
MLEPICCPVCGDRKLQAVLRKAVFTAMLGEESNVIKGVLAYRCAQGHLFTTLGASETSPGVPRAG